MTTLADARVRLHELKIIRKQGRCPRTELDEEKKQLKLEKQKVKQKPVTVKDVVELYLTERIEDRKDSDGKLIRGARKVKGQKSAGELWKAMPSECWGIWKLWLLRVRMWWSWLTVLLNEEQEFRRVM